MKIVIDAMGGDNAPKAHVAGAMAAVRSFKDIEIALVGDEPKIREHLTKAENISVLHTEEKIEDEDTPTQAVRRKKNASMVLSVREVREGRADACISSGNTGALMTAGLLHVGRIDGIERPALAPMLPTIDGEGFLLLDVGANVDAKPEHLLQNAYMGSVYMENVKKVQRPKVGLVNVGTEDGKGNELTKAAFTLLQEAPVHFVGNVEARDLLNGVCDVAVCDGFSGNLVLKSIEGTAGTLFSILKQELTSSFTNKIAAGMLRSSFMNIKEKMSYSHYGGAGLFGLKAPVIKAHGSSDHTAVYHAIRQARQMVHEHVTEVISEEVRKQEE
ncbi:phosphate:acyl-[acyl carrier protein] acyltransferase [Alteribacillus persepolensis]|uniref:Phosphate acyltransferase n=1 Tax=Alteribacillus persepolensis TaxID=568899 RepID=A0A1G7YK49_9BACI|nr:phosphate acyltransferase PlsX [Alteribacillus persepolensis]SDG96685.1 phosphate:acyl-[acyl carrier protein] acyltransferase [Alteribacillus persepolensis]